MAARTFHPPRPIRVVAPDGWPRAFDWRGRWRQVAGVERRWQQDHGWWRGPEEAISRDYFDLATRDGLRCVIYRDLLAEGWYLEQVYD